MTVNRPYIIAINGGIGSGKSVVSRIVTAMGYPVYDCDAGHGNSWTAATKSRLPYQPTSTVHA